MRSLLLGALLGLFLISFISPSFATRTKDRNAQPLHDPATNCIRWKRQCDLKKFCTTRRKGPLRCYQCRFGFLKNPRYKSRQTCSYRKAQALRKQGFLCKLITPTNPRCARYAMRWHCEWVCVVYKKGRAES